MADRPVMCLACGKQFAHTRGNCQSCYRRHRQQVVRGLTTWERLEAEGNAAPPAVPPRRPPGAVG
jgi:hypothetical protein